MKLKKNEYKCAMCGEVYKKGWSDEEAKKEMLELWGDLPEEEQGIVCDDCFKQMNPSNNKEMAREYGYKK